MFRRGWDVAGAVGSNTTPTTTREDERPAEDVEKHKRDGPNWPKRLVVTRQTLARGFPPKGDTPSGGDTKEVYVSREQTTGSGSGNRESYFYVGALIGQAEGELWGEKRRYQSVRNVEGTM